MSKDRVFSKYHVFVISILAILQFTVVLDFMVLSPLGAHLMSILSINPSQFGNVVSAYAFSAGISGILASGFSDKFDRKKMLLFFYVGFIVGTFLCAISNTYQSLLMARIITGIFGGVLSSVSYAIITDLFAVQVRGRVMGFVQMAFAASQILGIPLGLFLANKLSWHAPFFMIVVLALIVMLVIIRWLRPINEHLKIRSDKNPFIHFRQTIANKNYLRAFLTTTLLAIGGFMLMPFSSAFLVYNVKIVEENLPQIFMVTGIFSIIAGPLVGKLSDKHGKYNIFIAGSFLSILMVLVFTNLSPISITLVTLVNVILFIGISSRIISSSALMTAVPEPKDRGAFMGINSSFQYISGGIASAISGLIVQQPSFKGPLVHYNTVGWLVVCTMVVCVILMFYINKYVTTKSAL